jgi:hypothetical protein
MARIPRYELVAINVPSDYTQGKMLRRWAVKDANGHLVKVFGSKASATRKGSLSDAIGGRGTVRIKKLNGKIQEERTYPRSADPSSSRGRA